MNVSILDKRYIPILSVYWIATTKINLWRGLSTKLLWVLWTKSSLLFIFLYHSLKIYFPVKYVLPFRYLLLIIYRSLLYITTQWVIFSFFFILYEACTRKRRKFPAFPFLFFSLYPFVYKYDWSFGTVHLSFEKNRYNASWVWQFDRTRYW